MFENINKIALLDLDYTIVNSFDGKFRFPDESNHLFGDKQL